MKRARTRRLARLSLAAVTAGLALVAAGCGGDDDDDQEAGATTAQAAAPTVAGLGGSLAEIKQMARDEGQVNLVIWAGYADKSWANQFTQDTGCKVNTKDGASSDDMIDLISTGSYDGVSASGNATVRLMERGDAAPVNMDLVPNYADVQEGLKNQSYNSKDGVPYGVPHGRGPNLLMFRTDALPANTNSWSVIWEQGSLAKYKGKISIYDAADFIADAAVYLKATQPELNITNPYALDDKQFEAAVDLLKKQAPNVGEYWPGDVAKQVQSFTNKNSVVGTTWPYQVNLLNGAKVPIKAIKPKEGTTGWSDTWMIYSKAQNPNCMYLWMDYIVSPAAQAKVAEFFGEAPANTKACALTKDKNHCTKFHAEDEAWWKDVYYWTTPTKDCGDERGAVCKTQEEWKAAWTEIRG